MSNEAILIALQKHLFEMPSGIPATQTAWGSKAFTPTAGVDYQRIWFLPAKPFNYGGLTVAKRLSGVFQVDLNLPFGVDQAEAVARADAVVAWFRQGLSVTANNVTTVVDRTPSQKPGRPEGDRWVVPIDITYFANVQN